MIFWLGQTNTGMFISAIIFPSQSHPLQIFEHNTGGIGRTLMGHRKLYFDEIFGHSSEAIDNNAYIVFKLYRPGSLNN